MKKKLIALFVGMLIFYIFLFGIFIFIFEKQVSDTYIKEHPVERFF